LDELRADQKLLGDVLFGVDPRTEISTPRAEAINARAHHEAVATESIDGHRGSPTVIAKLAHGPAGPLSVVVVTKAQLTTHQIVPLNEGVGFDLQ
jgi:hypothetical protein